MCVYLGITREKSAKVVEVGVDSLPPSLLSFLVVLHGSEGSIMVGGCFGNLGEVEGVGTSIIGGISREGGVSVWWCMVEEGGVVGGSGGVGKELEEVRVVHGKGKVVHDDRVGVRGANNKKGLSECGTVFQFLWS